MAKDEATPNKLYERIAVCLEIIYECNSRLRAMKARPVDACFTPSDVPPFTWKKSTKRRTDG